MKHAKVFLLVMGGIFFFIGSSIPSGFLGVITLISGIACVGYAIWGTGKC